MVNLSTLWHYLALQNPLQAAGNLSSTGLTAQTLPPLPFAYDALEPHISAQIMELHHSKHHAAYVAGLNRALDAHVAAVAAGDVARQIELQRDIRFHGGGHINHSLFWKNLAPPGSREAKAPEEVAPRLVKAIERQWTSLQGFKEEFGRVALGIQGSGWGWLVKEEGSGRLRIVTTKDQDPVVGGDVPVLGVDMWEHAYYLQYLNGKAAYVENIWHVINWKTAEERFVGGIPDEKTEL
ncbi:hypothetical protein VTJ83DRAFT_3774 [Remersonia thermophila]|uniref:Superoxide dismutase n=1 Tax=Remersonia thermophila TaxID=72144 RepID=A0ABR4DEY3_9PEZI